MTWLQVTIEIHLHNFSLGNKDMFHFGLWTNIVILGLDRGVVL